MGAAQSQAQRRRFTKATAIDLEPTGSDQAAQKQQAAVVNDPELGMQIRPDGGMGTWGEDALVKNLAGKFTEVLEMLKVRNYSGLQQVLYKSKVVDNMLDSLVKYQQFKDKQGSNPVAPGTEIDLGEDNDYIPEA